MKIDSIHVSHFLGIEAVDIRTPRRVHLFAGKNGAGKSSLRDAVALALTADLGRVSLKKEAAALIREGSDLAVCEVTDADGDEFRVTINRSGKITDSRSGRSPDDPVMPYVLDAQRLARLDATDRRAFLFGLMGLKTDGPAIVERLLKRGIEKARIDRIAPMLRAGFDAASKEAKGKATEARGAWKAVTGETYGSEKAKTWRASVPPYDAKAAAALSTELQHTDVALDSWQQQVGKLKAEEQRRATLRAQLPALEEHALRIERIETKLATDQQQLADWQADLEKTQAAAGVAPRVGLVHELARVLMELLAGLPVPQDSDPLAKDFDACQAVLDKYVAEHGPVFADAGGDAKAAARLPSVRQSRDLMASAVANDKRDLAAAQAAHAKAEEIRAELAEPFDAAALENSQHQVDAFKAQRAEIIAKADKLKSIKAQIDAAEAKTKGAAQHAADVAAWEAIGEALAPDGIPGEMLAEALGPMNERLASSAVDADWSAVVIAPDMAITAGGREYRLLSESEKWRVDAVLAEAVAQLSGARLLVLDRFDVLDLQGRQDCLAWLDTLADAGEIDTALVFATLKALPAELPETIGASWIENGVCGALKEAA